MNNKEINIIAMYLPQFHPVKENDEIWGKGFTEWTNVASAKPLFRNHYQPQIPSELGFYDLRMDEIRDEQAALADQYGIYGFCYWNYWFGGGKTILDMPLERLISTKHPNFPFCVAWANHSWTTSTWNNVKRNKSTHVFLEQQYLGRDDYKKYFLKLLPAFQDERYIRVNGRLLFTIFDPASIPSEELKAFFDVFSEFAARYGLGEFCFVGRLETVGKIALQHNDYEDIDERIDYMISLGFNKVWTNGMRRAQIKSRGKLNFLLKRIQTNLLDGGALDIYKYEDIIKYLYTEQDKRNDVYPMIIPRWDKTPRQGRKATIYTGSTPALFEKHLNDCISIIGGKSENDRIAFLQAWNEWGEGNYLEPDIKYGRQYLEVIKRALNS